MTPQFLRGPRGGGEGRPKGESQGTAPTTTDWCQTHSIDAQTRRRVRPNQKTRQRRKKRFGDQLGSLHQNEFRSRSQQWVNCYPKAQLFCSCQGTRYLSFLVVRLYNFASSVGLDSKCSTSILEHYPGSTLPLRNPMAANMPSID